MKKEYFYEKYIFSRAVPLEKFSVSTTTLTKSFCKKAGSFLRRTELFERETFFSKKSSLKCSSGHVKCSFGYPAQNFGRKPTLVALCPRMIKQLYLLSIKKILFLKRPLWTFLKSFEKPGEAFSTEGWKLFAIFPDLSETEF